eukprot:g6406.t1
MAKPEEKDMKDASTDKGEEKKEETKPDDKSEGQKPGEEGKDGSGLFAGESTSSSNEERSSPADPLSRASVSPITGLPNRAKLLQAHVQFDKLEILECLESGIQYTYPPPTDEELHRVYDIEYNKAYGRDFSAGIPDFVERRAVAQRTFITHHLGLEPTPTADINTTSLGRVVEVGGGWGSLSSALQPLASSVICYELDSASVDFMREHGVDARVGTLQQAVEKGDVEANDIDLIVSSMMLEHLPRPLDSLRTWGRKLKAGGHLFVEVPLENPIPRWWGTDPAEPYWVGHITFFGPGHLEAMLEAAGFQVLASTPHDHPVSPGYTMPGGAPYDVGSVPVALDAQVSTSDNPRLLRVLARKPTA